MSDETSTLPPRVREYRRGLLSPEQERAFEERLMRDPELVEAVELDEALERGLPARSTRRRRPPLPWAAAASLLLGLGIGYSAAHWRTPSALPTDVQVVRLAVERGGARNVQLARRDGRALVLVVPVQSDGQHEITLDSPSQRLRLTTVAEHDRAATMIPAHTLTAAEYRVLIDGKDDLQLSLRLQDSTP